MYWIFYIWFAVALIILLGFVIMESWDSIKGILYDLKEIFIRGTDGSNGNLVAAGCGGIIAVMIIALIMMCI